MWTLSNMFTYTHSQSHEITYTHSQSHETRAQWVCLRVENTAIKKRPTRRHATATGHATAKRKDSGGVAPRARDQIKATQGCGEAEGNTTCVESITAKAGLA